MSTSTSATTQEGQRLAAAKAGTAAWQRWGTYLSERAWGTVREDYSADGDAWSHFPFEHAQSRVYRWNEDGLAGFCDEQQHICLSLALWNEQDPILKERMYGLSNSQGNHGEDAKDYWFYLDNLPTHAYAKMVYKYPQAAFPYGDLLSVNGQRGTLEPEYELFDALSQDVAGEPLLRRFCRVRQGRRRGHPVPRDGRQPRPRPGSDPRAAAAVVPQHLVVGP